MMELAGGRIELENKMKQAYLDKEYQWALELAEALLDTQNSMEAAKVMRYCIYCNVELPCGSRSA